MFIWPQIWWMEHVIRKAPKQVLVIDGHCFRGGQKKRFKETLKAILKKCNINIITWAAQALNCPQWHHDVHEIDYFEQACLAIRGDRQERWKERAATLHHQDLVFAPRTVCHVCNWTHGSWISLLSYLDIHWWLPCFLVDCHPCVKGLPPTMPIMPQFCKINWLLLCCLNRGQKFGMCYLTNVLTSKCLNNLLPPPKPLFYLLPHFLVLPSFFQPTDFYKIPVLQK